VCDWQKQTSGGVGTWLAKTFSSKSKGTNVSGGDGMTNSSSAVTSIPPADTEEQPKKSSSFAFWKKNRHSDTAKPTTTTTIAVSPDPESSMSASPSHSNSNSGVLYRPDTAGLDPKLDPPPHIRSSTVPPPRNHSPGHMPHSASFSGTAGDAESAAAASRDRSMSSAAVAAPAPSSYYTSTYYSAALSSLTAFQPSSANDYSRRPSSAAGSAFLLEDTRSPVILDSLPPARSHSRTPVGSALSASTTAAVSTPAPAMVSASPAPIPVNSPPASGSVGPIASAAPSKSQQLRVANFRKLLLEESLDLESLRRQAWQGIPNSVRSITWKILLGYLPTTLSRRSISLKKRREEYREYVQMYYSQNLTHDDNEDTHTRSNSNATDSPLHSQRDETHEATSSSDLNGSSTGAGSASSNISTSGGGGSHPRSESENDILRQIKQDVPRTAPGIPFFKRLRSQKSLERMLFIFAVRHPASGYVQGMNDVATPFYVVFLSEYLYPNAVSSATSTCAWSSSNNSNTTGGVSNSNKTKPGSSPPPPLPDADAPSIVHAPTPSGASAPMCAGDGLGVLSEGPSSLYPPAAELDFQTYLDLEADVFWCMSKLLDRVQDNYTFAQPGIQRMVYRLKELVSRIDAPLDLHLQKQNVQYIHFAFRWVNCLLMREMPMRCMLRLWDTYLAEDSAATASIGVGSATASGVSKDTGITNNTSNTASNAATATAVGSSLDDSDAIPATMASDSTSSTSSSSSAPVVSLASQYNGFRAFHLYVCAAFLVRFSSALRRLDFQELVLYLQRLPTEGWSEKEVETLLAQAFIYKSWFHASPYQLK
jgi:hypothetical protein